MLGKNASIASLSLIVGSISLLGSFSFAQEPNITCQNISFRIQGPEKVLIEKEYNFESMGFAINYISGSNQQSGNNTQNIKTGSYSQLLSSDTKIQYDIIANNKTLNRFYTDPVSYSFSSPGKYQLQATIEHPQCAYKILKDITAYTNIYSLIGLRPNETLASIAQNAEQQNIGFIELSNGNRKESININKELISDSQAIIVSSTEYSEIFDSLQQLSESGQQLKDILLITQNPKPITKKVVAPFLKSSSLQNIFLLDTQELTNVLIQLTIGEKPNYQNHQISYENKSIFGSLDTIIDNLIYQGFPIELMSIILSLTLAIAIVVFRKQVIGFSSFGVYYPILFGLYIHLLGTKTSLGLLAIALIAIFVVAIINNKLTLLASAKTGTIIVVYFILSLIGLRTSKRFANRPVAFSTFSQYLFVVAYVTMPLIAQKVVGTKISKTQKKLKQIMLFLILSAIIYVVFQNNAIQQRMLIHPIYTILIGIVIILLGRYTGLQLTEFFRFSHLIKHIIQKKRSRGKT